MSKPDGPGVIRASIVVLWHFGHGGLGMVMMLALNQAGALQNSQSPLTAIEMRRCNKIACAVSDTAINTDRFPKNY
jgi:hypothetical protein